MPRPITLTRRWKHRPAGYMDQKKYPVETEVATEAELLEFANKLRAAGDAAPLAALMPSKPDDANACLIANALNFSSQVDLLDAYERWDDGSFKWKIVFPENMPAAQIERIAEAAGLERHPDAGLEEWPEYDRTFILPKIIGNVAHAFDSGDGFQEYAKDSR